MTRAAAVAAVVVLLAVAPVWAPGAGAQTPPVPAATPAPGRAPTEAEALAVEHELLCPLCVNERLDICTLAVCSDMKQIVRARLAQGASTEEIIAYFEARYGPHIRAELPPRGFNLVLFGGVGGALLLTAMAAAIALRSMRRAAPRPSRAGAASEDAALDALIDAAALEESGGTREGTPGERGGERGTR